MGKGWLKIKQPQKIYNNTKKNNYFIIRAVYMYFVSAKSTPEVKGLLFSMDVHVHRPKQRLRLSSKFHLNTTLIANTLEEENNK